MDLSLAEQVWGCLESSFTEQNIKPLSESCLTEVGHRNETFSFISVYQMGH